MHQTIIALQKSFSQQQVLTDHYNNLIKVYISLPARSPSTTVDWHLGNVVLPRPLPRPLLGATVLFPCSGGEIAHISLLVMVTAYYYVRLKTHLYIEMCLAS